MGANLLWRGWGLNATPIWASHLLDGARRAAYGKFFVAAALIKVKMVNRSAPDLFPAAYILKKWFSSAQGEKPRAFDLDAGEILQPIENAVILMVKELPIKWNLMPEFFHLLGRAKVR